MKIKTLFVRFFKCSIVLRVGAVIFKLNKISMSNFGKFKFWSKNLKIEGAFKNEQNFESKTDQKGQEFSK